jgi:hypothetical protein
MPRGTRVAKCVSDLKKKGGGVNPYAVCQVSTQEGYKKGRTLPNLKKLHKKWVKGMKGKG